MKFAVSVDVGVRNLGICVFDFTTSQVVYWQSCSLVQNGPYSPSQNVQYVKAFVDRHQHFFTDASVVVVERQMRLNMRIIEAILQTMFYERCIVMQPSVVKKHYNLSTGSYRGNKDRAIKWADMFVQHNPHAFTTGITDAYRASAKKDDFADALVMLLYYLDTYSNQLTESHGHFSTGTPYS